MNTVQEIGRLAAITKIWLNEEEAEELSRDMAPLFELADTLSEADIGDGISAIGAVSVSALREDIPMRVEKSDNEVGNMADDEDDNVIGGIADDERNMGDKGNLIDGMDEFVIPRLIE